MSLIEEDLRQFRLDLSKEIGIPPYCIFDDKSLIDLCDKLPDKKEWFVFVKGFSTTGTSRVETYADGIINIISHFLKTEGRVSPLYKLIEDYKLIISEFIKSYNNRFKDKEITELLTGTAYIKLLVSRIDDFYDVIQSSYYGILKNVKDVAIHSLILEMINEQILKKDLDGFISIY